MDFDFSIFNTDPFFQLPTDIVGWLVWFALAALLLFILVYWRRFNSLRTGTYDLYFVVLLILTLLFSLLIGLQLPSALSLPSSPIPAADAGPTAMLFSAFPWLLAASFLGPLPACLLAGLSGLVQAYFASHSIFIPLYYALLGAVVSISFRQRYRTAFFQALRHPLLVSLVSVFFYFMIYILTEPLIWNAPYEIGVDHAIANSVGASAAFGLPLIFGGLIAEGLASWQPETWYGTRDWEPAPVERSLEARLMTTMAPLVLSLIVLLVAGDWFIAQNAARKLLRSQMQMAADPVAIGIPQLLATGQNLIAGFADDDVLISSNDSDRLTKNLESMQKQNLYFDQLTLLDKKGRSLAGYPVQDYQQLDPTQQEQLAVQLSLDGITPPIYSLPPAAESEGSRFSFSIPVLGGDGGIKGVLIGRTTLDDNPFAQPLIGLLQAMQTIGGEGLLLDERGMILFHTDPVMVGKSFETQLNTEGGDITARAADGMMYIQYTKEVEGKSWYVVTRIPQRIARQTALQVAMPVFGMLLVIAGIAYFVLRSSLQVVSGTLQQLASVSKQIAEGNLDQPLQIKGHDEVARLGESFERMRLSLKSRLDEVTRLLSVSQGVASTLDIETAVQPILEGAIKSGASSVRIILDSKAFPDHESVSTLQFGLGPASAQYELLDQQILKMVKEQERVYLSNPARAGLLGKKVKHVPGALLALALNYEQAFYGALWVGFDKPYKFSEEEERFFSSLARQTALAAANARLYHNAHIGRQRLEAILASTPDPVLVTDHEGQLLIANPAALKLLGDQTAFNPGVLIERIIHHPELLEMLRTPQEEPRSAEIEFPNDQVYYATASPVITENRRMGQVCVLRNITHLKEMDSLKTEFVSTVSHDLRSPLTLMRGYATMLQMVGDMNTQQSNYLDKIISGIDDMSQLVNSLLDLGRIEAGVGLKLELLPLQDVAQQVIDSLQTRAAQKKIELTMHAPPGAIHVVEADQALLQQALHNLLENAIKYTDNNGKIEVELTSNEDQVTLSISDNGVGIAPVDIPRLFDHFYRGGGDRSQDDQGSGLGLTIVKSIVERHGGKVSVDSRLGEGSTFTITLPLRQ